jgi:Tfp pilus assembly protein PilN
MRPVNLLPQDRRVNEGGNRPGIAYAVVGALGLLLVGVVLYVVCANGVASKQDELARLTAETQAAQQRVAQLGAFNDFAAIKQRRQSSITQLAQARIDWERLVRELSRVIPEDVFVTSLEASSTPTAQTAAGAAGAATSSAPQAGGPSLTLGGCAPTNSDIATFMVRLRKLHRAEEVSLESSQRIRDASAQCARGSFAFKVAVGFAPAEQGAKPEPVPAHLGGGA